MGPNLDRQPGVGIPVSAPESMGDFPVGDNNAERSIAHTPESLKPSTSPPSTAIGPIGSTAPMVPLNPIAANNPSASQNSTPASSLNPAVADDKDLIEKEWVEKAKKIVEATRTDPHMQTREMNIFKADYIKKRYNKELKTAD